MTIQELNEQTKAELERNVSNVFSNIERIRKENKIEKEVTLLAATKTVPADVINYTTQVLGIKHIGENRVQELVDKYDDLVLDGVKVHFIGKLQTNKVKYIIDKVDLIHSLDSIKLAAEIDKRAKGIGKVMDVLVEINSGREENKSGIFPEEVDDFLEKIKEFRNIRVKGFMTIAPVCSEKSDYRKYFGETY
ncbi:MAG: YggS family pyridoxal phosphate-dependent enzyme, partial [Clostridia bacterium]|nr:YggS family pyridoxal phosphate-dependent enzyme [Clostridia bacterium]